MERSRPSAYLALAVGLSCASALGQSTARVSLDSNGAQANGSSYDPYVSSDGRYVVFWSAATNLVPGDTNGNYDVFVHDRQTGSTTRASLASNGAQADGSCVAGSISDDGRYVAFQSWATTLVPGDTNGWSDAFVRDLQTGITTRVSVSTTGAQGNRDAENPRISADGRYVAFQSTAGTLVPGDTNGKCDVFVRDLFAGTTERVSVGLGGAQSNGDSTGPTLSADGRYVAFGSAASNLVPGDVNSARDVFVRDRVAGATWIVSVASDGSQANNSSVGASISADGRWVAFDSGASNLVPGDTNSTYDVFVHDLQTGATERVSVDSNGVEGDWLGSSWPSISADGNRIAFTSDSTNLVPGDTNSLTDVFLHDRTSGETTRASVATDGTQGDGPSHLGVSISADGSAIAFSSASSQLVPGDTNASYDVFVREPGNAIGFTVRCAGDGSGAPCPCGNSGAPGAGCDNSAATGGGSLSGTGAASVSNDTLALTANALPVGAPVLFFQGASSAGGGAGFPFGDGLRCAVGSVWRLGTKIASNGDASYPGPGDPPISTRGHLPASGGVRVYQAWYRDPAPFCAPEGFNLTNGLEVSWTP